MKATAVLVRKILLGRIIENLERQIVRIRNQQIEASHEQRLSDYQKFEVAAQSIREAINYLKETL